MQFAVRGADPDDAVVKQDGTAADGTFALRDEREIDRSLREPPDQHAGFVDHEVDRRLGIEFGECAVERMQQARRIVLRQAHDDDALDISLFEDRQRLPHPGQNIARMGKQEKAVLRGRDAGRSTDEERAAERLSAISAKV